MKNNESLCPDFNIEEVRSPFSILQKQARFLGEKTGNIVATEVMTTKVASEIQNFLFSTSLLTKPLEEEGLRYDFYLVAPKLENYRYKLFYVIHFINLYPLEICFNKQKFSAGSEEGFKDKLQKIFADKETLRIITILYSQSK